MIGSPVLGDQRGDPSFAIRRGIVIHALLQMLPNLDAGQRVPAAKRYLSRAAFDWKPEDVENALQSVLAVMEDPGFQPVFRRDRWRKLRSWERCICAARNTPFLA